MATNDIQQHLEATAKREQKRIASEIVDRQIKIITAAYSQSTAYAKLILLAAYAGVFGLWQLTRDYLSKGQALWAALLMLVSLSIFVLFEIYKMTFISIKTFQQAQLLRSPEAIADPSLLLRRLSDIEVLQEGHSPSIMRAWAVSLLLTVGFGLAAGGILAFAFINGLLE